MAFLEDPRLRQRWNQITHDAEAATENAAAGIWSFQQNYLNPCFGQMIGSIEQCTAVCLGDPEERLRRRRERERQAQYSFDFYDDWYQEENGGGASNGGASGGGGGGGGGGLFSSFRGEDWDRLLAGTGSQRRHGTGETSEQPKRRRGMSYGTYGNKPNRRKPEEEDPNVIPSTHAIGILGKLPWKMGGQLRYKPSAADLQEHPWKPVRGEEEPLLGADDALDRVEIRSTRERSGTTGSGHTSDSYRSRGDLFPSDGEGEEDAIPLDDEITYDMVRKDDRSSGKTRKSKGKRPQFGGSRSVSRTTLGSLASYDSMQSGQSDSIPPTPQVENIPSLEDLAREEQRLQEEEDEELARRKAAATQLATERGLTPQPEDDLESLHSEPISAASEVVESQALASEETPNLSHGRPHEEDEADEQKEETLAEEKEEDEENAEEEEPRGFVPARLPHFG